MPCFRGTVLLKIDVENYEGKIEFPKNYYSGDCLLHLDFLSNWVSWLEHLEAVAIEDVPKDFKTPQQPSSIFKPLKARYIITTDDVSTGSLDIPEWFEKASPIMRLHMIRDWSRAFYQEIKRVKATDPY